VKSACGDSNSPKIQAIKKAGTLHWGIGISPPFGFTSTSNNWEGVEAENAVEIAGILGVKPDIISYDYSVMTTALQSGKADIVGAQLFVTPERQKVIDFSLPYYKSGQIYYVLQSSKYQTIQDLNTPSNRFVYGTGGAQGGLATKFTPLAHQAQVPLQGQLIPYQFLSTGRADSTMGESAAWPVLQKKFTNPPLAAIGKQGRVSSDLPTEADMLDPFDVALGLPKNDTGWKACVDAWVQWGTNNGPIKQRVDYWLRHQTEAGG
jgi:ABC-type amino acid transport substrate-binding protein